MREFIKPYRIRSTPEAEVRKAYSELRSVANKRIQRLNKAGLSTDTKLFPTIQQIKESDKFDVQSALADVQQFLKSPRTTVSGHKKWLKEFKETLTDKGYGDLVETNEDLYNMIDYMDWLREQYSEKLFDSGDALDVLQEGRRLNIPKEKLMQNYELFASNIDKMEKLRRSPKGKTFSQKRIDNLKKKWN